MSGSVRVPYGPARYSQARRDRAGLIDFKLRLQVPSLYYQGQRPHDQYGTVTAVRVDDAEIPLTVQESRSEASIGPGAASPLGPRGRRAARRAAVTVTAYAGVRSVLSPNYLSAPSAMRRPVLSRRARVECRAAAVAVFKFRDGLFFSRC
eukprot:448480-Hanusia_phi.AAC.1